VHPVVGDLTAQLGVPAELHDKTVNIEGGWAECYGAPAAIFRIPADQNRCVTPDQGGDRYIT
jgi:hypothetical protein